jgi:hypothetical protein
MLLGNPFPMHLYSADQYATRLAPVHSPLFPISVFGKKCLQIIAEGAVARLDWLWHFSPVH